MITALIEAISHYRFDTQMEQLNERYRTELESLKKASGDKLLQEAVRSEPIYSSIKRHITDQAFRRSDFTVSFVLKWVEDEDPPRAHLEKSQTVSYRVYNVFPSEATSTISAFDERKYIGHETYETTIQEVKIATKSGKNKSYKRSELLALGTTEEIAGNIVATKVPLTLIADDYADIFVESKSTMPARDVLVLVVVQPTINMRLEIVHPHDLSLDANPIFPDREALKLKTNQDNRKIWVVEAGLLPFQGIELVFFPSPTPALPS